MEEKVIYPMKVGLISIFKVIKYQTFRNIGRKFSLDNSVFKDILYKRFKLKIEYEYTFLIIGSRFK